MRAAVFYETGGPEVLRYEEVPDPEPGANDVLVEVAAISIEGGDTLHRGDPDQRGVVRTTPHVVGYQCAGTIREVGADVQDRRVGQRVVCTMMAKERGKRYQEPDDLIHDLEFVLNGEPPRLLGKSDRQQAALEDLAEEETEPEPEEQEEEQEHHRQKSSPVPRI